MKAVFTIVVIAFIFASSSLCIGDRLRFDSFERGEREIALLAGYGENHKIPSATKNRFNFDILKFRYGVFTSPRTQLAFDLATGIKDRDDTNYAVWTTASYRRYFLARGSTAVGYDLSFGLLHMNHGVQELGTKTNFTEQIGLVLQHGLGPSSALTLEYKFSHISNANIKLPNIGINASMFTMGYSWYK